MKGSRILILWHIMEIISDMANTLSVPTLFLGDLIHNPKYIENGLLQGVIHTYKNSFEKKNVDFYAISGNHDLAEKNTKENRSVSYITTLSEIFKTFKDLDFNSDWLAPGIKIHGIPYLNGNIGFNQELRAIKKSLLPNTFNILMIHTDLPQAKNAFGHKIDEVEGINTKLFRYFDLVLDGHIHNPQKLYKNTYILGPPYQQTRSEKGTELGYWLIYKEKEPKFVPLNFPKFIDIEEGKEVPNDGNFYTVIPKPRPEFKAGKKYDAKIDRVKLGKRYLKHTGVKDSKKEKALIKILNSAQ